MANDNVKCWDAVVVGAGPVGLSLALGLAKQGRDVLVLEKESGTAEHSRAPAIWPATLEVLGGLGVVDTFLERGIVVPRLELWDVDREAVLISLPLEELADETPYPHLLVLPQATTERILLEAVQREPTAKVQFDSKVTDLAQDRWNVQVQCSHSNGASTVESRFVAGCDGAHSTVRQLIGASFEGETYKIRAALADVEIDASEEMRFPRISTKPHIAIGIRLERQLWRLILPYSDTDEMPLQRRVDEAVASLFDMDFRMVWKSEFHLHRRVSSQFANGRVVLAGDAAHVNSPIGGQGMNAGIKDAELLATAMADAIAQDHCDPLSEFAGKRRQQVREGVNRFTDLLTRALLTGRGRMLRPAMQLGGAALRVAPLRRRFLRNLAMLD